MYSQKLADMLDWTVGDVDLDPALDGSSNRLEWSGRLVAGRECILPGFRCGLE